MHESEWADVVAQARGRWAEHETFDLVHLFTACKGLHLIGDSQYPSFLSDARMKSIEGGELTEQADGKWRARSIVEEEEEDPMSDPQEPQPEPEPQQEEPVPDDAEGTPAEEGATYEREIVVERQGQGQWAIWDSATNAWESIGKEQDAIKEGRTRAKSAGVETRMRVVGVGRKVKYERVYTGKTKAATRTKASPSQTGTSSPVPPPLPGEDPAVPVPTPIAVASRTEDDRAQSNGQDPEGQAVLHALRAGLVLVDLNGDGESVAAIDPAAVVAILPDGEYVGLHMQGGVALRAKTDLLTLVSMINRGRE